MNILAIIPARAGSKGIPNKNIRIICEHPLIYYSIKNAIDSEMITDIIVTTDSPEVRIIAQQMGVRVHQRDKSLCEDDVTLDAVIADAIPNNNWDYIVTMQPTSPTLTVETLDAAIKYAIDNNLDTLISAINRPHLTWSEKRGKKVPNFKERVNRQKLPPCYVETGAFVVSKASIVTPQSRIGESVDVYEVPENEAYDIDSFEDLMCVNTVMSQNKIGIYVNGNNNRGMGHIYRVLEIADEFYIKPDIYFDTNQTKVSAFGNTKHNLKPVDGVLGLFDECRKQNYSLFINDDLSTSTEYMQSLKHAIPNARIVNFEDDGEGAIKADLVINALFNEEPYTNVRAGEKYYISGKLFMLYSPIKINSRVKRIFVSFGGADPQNYTDRILNIISKPQYRKFEFVVVLGRAKKNADRLMCFNEYNNIKVLYDVTNMPEIMTSCDIGITSRGRTGYELALLGIPTIAMAQNEREEKHSFVCNENGFSYIGRNPDDQVIESNIQMYIKMSQEGRQRYQNMLLSHDLRKGRDRVMTLINGL